jgi:PAS domain S-box-containing protein
VIKDASGNPKGFIATTKDITELRRAEQALRRSEQRFRDIAEHASEWIWEVDAQGIYTYSSPVIRRILGYEPEEVLGKHFHDLYPPEEREQKKEAVFDVFAKKRPFTGYVHRNTHKNGRQVWLSTSGVPIIDDDGRLMGYRGADTDITEGRQAEEQFAAEKEHLIRTLRAVEDGVIATDLKGGIVIFNKAAEDLTGCSENEAIGRNLGEVFGAKPTEASEDIFAAVMRSGSGSRLTGQATLTTPDGLRTNVSYTAARIYNKDNKVSGVAVIFGRKARE